MNLKSLLASAALIATLPMAASAITLSGEATSAVIEDEFGTIIVNTGSGTNVAVLSLGPVPAEFNVNVNVADNGMTPGFEALQEYVNDSGNDTVFTISTLLTSADFVAPALSFSLDNVSFTDLGSNVFSTSGGSGESFIVADGASFWVLASADDVVSAGNFDYNLAATPVPVPAGILLMGTALAGFGVMRRRKKAA